MLLEELLRLLPHLTVRGSNRNSLPEPLVRFLELPGLQRHDPQIEMRLNVLGIVLERRLHLGLGLIQFVGLKIADSQIHAGICVFRVLLKISFVVSNSLIKEPPVVGKIRKCKHRCVVRWVRGYLLLQIRYLSSNLKIRSRHLQLLCAGVGLQRDRGLFPTRKKLHRQNKDHQNTQKTEYHFRRKQRTGFSIFLSGVTAPVGALGRLSLLLSFGPLKSDSARAAEFCFRRIRASATRSGIPDTKSLASCGGGPCCFLEILIDDVLQVFRNLEYRHEMLFHLDLFAGSRITGHSPLPFLYLEAPESSDLDVLPCLHRIDHSRDEPIDHGLGFHLRQSRRRCNDIYYISFRQGTSCELLV